MDKYSKLWERFDGKIEAKITLSFDEIKNIAWVDVDHSFLKFKKNLENHGYTLEKILQKERLMVFRKLIQGQIVLVDENDNQIWLWEKMDVHEKWLLHRAISVLILNENWDMLLQQRALWKYHCPWLWSNATCTHPYSDEEPVHAAHRRLQEEMWFDCEIEEIFSFKYIAHFDNWLTENEYDHVFVWTYNWEIKINSNEVNDYKWINIDELKKDIVEKSDIYTPWFKIILEKYFSLS